MLVNNAANDDRHKVEDVTEEYWDDRLNVNLKHHFFCAQAVVPGMRSEGRRSDHQPGIDQLASRYARLVLYQTCKAAIEGLTRSLARDLGRRQHPRELRRPGQRENSAAEQWYTPEGEAEIVRRNASSTGSCRKTSPRSWCSSRRTTRGGMTGHEYFVDAGWR